MLSAKLARLKQAKDEAEKEIAEYRAHVELEFQKKVAAVSLHLAKNFQLRKADLLVMPILRFHFELLANDIDLNLINGFRSFYCLSSS